MELNLLPIVFVVTATWLVHSSLLLGGAALVSRVYRNIPPRMAEWLWKTAILLPCLTTAIQCSNPQALALWQWQLALPENTRATPTARNEIAPAPDPPGWPSPNPDASPARADWQIEILPDDSPAIAEKPISHTLDPAMKKAPLVSLSGMPEERLVALGPAVPQVPSENGQKAPLEAAHAPPSQVSTELYPFPDPQAGNPWFVSFWVGLVFVLGMIGGGRLLWLCIKARNVLLRASPLSTGPAWRELQKLLAQCDQSIEIELVDSDAISIPAAAGLFRRRIVLPRGIESRFNRDELQALLAHELGHHVRGDVWWLWCGRVACHLLPWQPLLFLAARRWQQAAEPLCDDWAIAQRINPVTLAKSLTQVAECQLTQPLVGPAAAQTPSQLGYRVKRLLEYMPPHGLGLNRRLLGVAALLIASVVVAGAPAIVWPFEEEQTDPIPITEADARQGDQNTSRDSRTDAERESPTVPSFLATTSHSPDSARTLPPDVRRELEATTADLNRMLRLLKDHNKDLELQEVANRLRRKLENLRSRSLIDSELGHH